MAVFNPQGPNTNFQEFTNVSRPISDLTADKSAAIAIAGGAQLLDEAVKLTDQTFKQQIDKEVYEGTDKQRLAYTDALETARNLQLNQQPVALPQPRSLLPEEYGPPAPPNLDAGIARISQIGTAIAQGGNKINDTLYTGALNAMAKQLRNQYPGYRDYIDEKIKSVTGMDPANAYYRNLMEDINRGNENQKHELNATLGNLRTLQMEGFADVNGVKASDVSSLVKSGQISIEAAEKWINSSKNVEWNIKQRANARKDRQESDADAFINAKKDVALDTGQIIQQGWDTMTIGQNTDTPAKLFEFIQRNAGNQAVKDERSVAIGLQLKAMRTQMFKAAWEKAVAGGEGSILTKFGGDAEALKTHINGQFAVLDRAIDDITKGDWASANSHMLFNKAIKSDTTNILYNAPDEDIRKYNRMVGSINDISPQAASEFFKSTLMSDVPLREKEWLKTVKMDLITQVDKNTGKFTSLTNVIEKSQAIKASPKTNQELIKTVDEISNPNFAEEHRVNVARSFFDPMINGPILSDKNFKVDYYDTERKRQIPGKYSVFTRFASDRVATSVAELNKRHPELIPMYRETMSKEFGEQLFHREIKTLAESNASSDISSPYQIKFINDRGQAPRFVFADRNGDELTMTQATAIRAPVTELNRLNTGMAGLYNVYDKTGSKDPNTDVLSIVNKYGFANANMNTPSKGWTGEFTDVPRMLWNSMVASQREQMKKIRDRLAPKEEN